ncbi:ATP synthase subunit C [Peptoniphilus sp. HMSC075B08]|uniref:V-type ATPase subunit n=1 Tax=Peptoniphilus sp. HMSC075B08 TaxID=1739525 RepID=UPI0008A4F935|nr:V-type ATPase subunit [Peptoniphilus sp. HMSC075B08]OFO60606.1 ATP synthase subunit C [Peptoniphilus sp. HMSC075B08]
MFEVLKALNAKILKMYSDFLVYEDFVNMAEGDNVRFCLSYLKEKKFPNIDSFSDIYEIEEFLQDYRRRQVKKLQGFLPGKYSDFIKAYMEREKVEKIVKILRALRMDKEPRVEKLVINGRNIPFKEESFESFIDNLKDTPYYDYMKNYKSSRDEDSLFSIEMNLDKYYYRNLTESIKSLSKADRDEFKKIFGVKIDLLNIIWIYRAKKYYDISPEEIFNFTIFGGNYNSEKLLHLSYIDEEEFEEEIKKSKYSILFADGRVIRTGRTSKKLMYSIANKNFRRTDGIGKFMSFLILLDSEIENIERILEATRFGLSKEEKLKYMIVDRKESEEVGR